ncbi:MAG: hypothetical protein IKY10_00205 [Clostridia bacterium]|nr:hypothetical protein [Clostridia bacterium]
MNNNVENEINKQQTIKQVCDFFRFEKSNFVSINIKDTIKELCVARLCKAIGVPKYNFKSDFFDFFASIMGEAVCEKLLLRVRIASDELRLVKYNGVNLVTETKKYLDTETVEEAFLDAFELVDNYQYLIPYLKKSSEN